MRINDKNQTIDMEARDLNFIMPAYIRSYQYYMKGEDPKEIIFPMFPSALSASGVWIPIRYIEPTSSLAGEIAKDGSDVPEVTEDEEEKLDAKDEAAKEVKEQIVEPEEKPTEQANMKKLVEDMDTVVKTIENGVKLEATQPDRQPKMPASGDIGPGTHPDSMGSRDIRADRQIVKDLTPEPSVDESEEIEAEIEKPTKQ